MLDPSRDVVSAPLVTAFRVLSQIFVKVRAPYVRGRHQVQTIVSGDTVSEVAARPVSGVSVDRRRS